MTAKLGAIVMSCFYAGFWCSSNLLRWAEPRGAYVASFSGWPLVQSQSVDHQLTVPSSPYFEAMPEAVWVNLLFLLLGTLLTFFCSLRLLDRLIDKPKPRHIVRPDFKLQADVVDFHPKVQRWPFLPSLRTIFLSLAVFAFLYANVSGFFGGSSCHSWSERRAGFPLTYWKETFELYSPWSSSRTEEWCLGKMTFNLLLGLALFGASFRLCRKGT
ncbi:MAG: hypothetical protein RL095_943 [Verrucomicrobiota bacterium]|jgi:hypothetical protein